MNARKHTRRRFLQLAGMSAVGAIVAACARQPEVAETVAERVVTAALAEPPTTPAAQSTPKAQPTEPESQYHESPMLAERVARGELPPVDQRLPEEPRVTRVMDGIGQYGGTLTVGMLSSSFSGDDAEMVMGDWQSNWGRISHDLTRAEPNVLKEFWMNDDLTVFTGVMRKGMKWSDGAPLTTEDLRFWYEDYLLNTDVTPMYFVDFRWGGEPMKLEIIDEYTFTLTFAQPHAHWLLVNVAHLYGFWGAHQTWVPSHYLKPFHIKYNDRANEIARENGEDFWYQHIGGMNNPWWNAERPVLRPYVVARDTPTMSFLERNPYYYAVDPEGNQLPYIDEIHADRCADLTILDAKTVGGQYDFGAFQLRILYYSTYAEGAEAANAHVKLWQTGKGSEVVYNVNCNYDDDEWRNVFMDDRFRQALSLAINRAEINNAIYFGNASETQMTVIPISRHYKPEYAAAYAEFDLDKANTLLDEMGLAWNRAHTHRTWPICKQDIVISWELFETETPKGPITELVTEYWRAIGIEIRTKSIMRNLLQQRILANEEPMSLWHGDETADTLFLRTPKWFAPRWGDESCWGVFWGQWHGTNGEQGQEPPDDIKQLYAWLDEYNITDSAEPARKVLESQAEHIWTIGTVGNAPHPLICRNTLRNVSETGGYWTWDSLWVFPEFAETWYLEQ